MRGRLLEKQKYNFEDLNTFISQKGSINLKDLVETDIDGHLCTLFVNHTLIVKDVEGLALIKYDDIEFIHGVVDVYDRVLRENLYNFSMDDTSSKSIENAHIADIIIQSNLVINVIELNTANHIQHAPGETIALENKYLIELYTGWHTQLHHREHEFFKLFC
ncbi:hypothetical protein ACJ2A9_17895 [Anaerobacillus sp. MEB173]|uniref:hypothetical protein n=1 Tax=Anaerobacillus sp. MEB173 TaxID=3383345 RepID=UPI003F92B679